MLALLEISHSRGCYLKFAVLLVLRVCSPNDQIPKRDPGLCALVAYIAGDTLHHQPMGTGHMTVLQLCGPMGFRVLQWCHPMLACIKRTSCCTRIITLVREKWIQARATSSSTQNEYFVNIVGYSMVFMTAFLDVKGVIISLCPLSIKNQQA